MGEEIHNVVGELLRLKPAINAPSEPTTCELPPGTARPDSATLIAVREGTPKARDARPPHKRQGRSRQTPALWEEGELGEAGDGRRPGE